MHGPPEHAAPEGVKDAHDGERQPKREADHSKRHCSIQYLPHQKKQQNFCSDQPSNAEQH